MNSKIATAVEFKEGLVAKFYRFFYDGFSDWSESDLENIVVSNLEPAFTLQDPIVQNALAELEESGFIKIFREVNLYLKVLDVRAKFESTNWLSLDELEQLMRAWFTRGDMGGKSCWEKETLERRLRTMYFVHYRIDQPEVQNLLKRIAASGLITISHSSYCYVTVSETSLPVYFVKRPIGSAAEYDRFDKWLERKKLGGKVAEMDPTQMGFATAEPGQIQYFRFFQAVGEKSVWVLRRSDDDRKSYFEPYDPQRHLV